MPFQGGAESVESAELHTHRLHLLLDRVPAMIAYWDQDCRNVIANAAYFEWFGWTPEKMRGVHIREVLGDELYAKNLPFITGALRGEEQLFERTLVDTAGRVRHTQASYVPDLVEGKNVGFFVLVTDVTPRVEAQRAMDDAQRLAHLGSWTMDADTGEIAWSAELYRILGLDPATFVPSFEDVMDRVDPGDVERVRAQVQRAREEGLDYDLTYRIRGAEGALREVHSQGHSHTGPDGTVVRLSGTVQDVTASNAAARELSSLNRELRNLNQLNADVLAMLGHDVRAPLTVILGYLEALTDGWDEDSDSQRRDQLARVFKAAQRLQFLVDDILAMATADSGRIVARPEVTSALDLVREAVDGVGHGASVTLAAAGEPLAFCDPFHVRQIVRNLVTNAIRYGEPPIQVSIESCDDASVTVTVRDHGPGVPEDQVASMFARFGGQGSDQHGARSGAATGFGLYIAAGLAAANNASLTYERLAPGASFCLRLPGATAQS